MLLPKRTQSYLGLLSAFSALLCFGIVTHFSLNVLPFEPVYFSVDWFPMGYVKFSLLADGLALFFALLITGMGVLVFYYANFFMDSTDSKIKYFYCYMNLFMGAMLGAVFSNNLLVFFLFWEITGVMSYLLISYHYELHEARVASRMAFLITSIGSLCLLVGIIIVGVLDQTLEIAEVTQRGIVSGEHSFWFFAVMILFLTGIATKSAQYPFYFWLPEAMTAPTPVSAYLHSATMVKLGVYLLARVYVLFIDGSLWFPLVTTLSMVTVIIGGFLALFATSLKRILAYATISQLGFFISFYGMGDPEGIQYDYIHIFNHALYKGSLFMLVGILAHAASIKEVTQLGGIYKKLPIFSVIFAVSIAAMAGVPGTTGFLSKELLVKDVILLFKEEPVGAFVVMGLITGLLFKVAFSFRLFYYAFLHRNEQHIHIQERPNFNLLIPPLLLSSFALIFGIWPGGLETLSNIYSIEGLHKQELAEVALWHGFSINLAVSACLFAGGILLFYGVKHFITLHEKFRFAQYWNFIVDQLPDWSGWLTSLVHSQNPQKNLRWVFTFLIILVGSTVVYLDRSVVLNFRFSLISLLEVFLIVTALMLLFVKQPVGQLICLSLIGFFVTFYFVLKEAPDVAITQMLVEVATLFVFVLLLFKIKPQRDKKTDPIRAILALFGGLTVASLPFFNGGIAEGDQLGLFYLQNSLSAALGANPVNTILVDFRGLDTLGEISVIIVSALSVAALLMKRKEPLIVHNIPLIPTPMLRAIMPAICSAALVFSLYLLVRGHNHPGGGFAGGMNVAISLVLASMCMRKSRIFLMDRLNLFYLMMGGLLLALFSGIISTIMSNGFMNSYYIGHISLLGTPFLFDLGIFVLIIGSVTSILYVIRENTLREVNR